MAMQRPFAAIAVACVLMCTFCAAEIVWDQVHMSAAGKGDTVVLDLVSNSSSPLFVAVGVASTAAFLPHPDTHNITQTTVGRYNPEIGYFHTVVMQNLSLGVGYTYTIGTSSSAGWGPVIKFTPISAHGRVSNPIAAVLADFGLVNDVSMNDLVAEGQAGNYDSMVIAGDLAYDLFSNNSQTGNSFMNALQPVAELIPLQVCAGNHEHADNFVQYSTRFNGTALGAGAASGSNTPMYYSYDQGNVHWIAVNTEVYLFPNQTNASPYPFKPDDQLAWLEADLQRAVANRAQVPWIVVYGHKPWYVDFQPHRKQDSVMVGNFTGFNRLLVEYDVDMYFTGHVHIYRRFYPLNGPAELKPHAKPQDVDTACVDKVNNVTNIYRNPKYPTTVVVGSPGDDEVTFAAECFGGEFVEPQIQNTFASCIPAYGYGLLQGVNSTHLHWQWRETGGPTPTDDDKTPNPPPFTPSIKDELWIVKDRTPSEV